MDMRYKTFAACAHQEPQETNGEVPLSKNKIQIARKKFFLIRRKLPIEFHNKPQKEGGANMARNHIRWLIRPVAHCKEGCCTRSRARR